MAHPTNLDPLAFLPDRDSLLADSQNAAFYRGEWPYGETATIEARADEDARLFEAYWRERMAQKEPLAGDAVALPSGARGWITSDRPDRDGHYYVREGERGYFSLHGATMECSGVPGVQVTPERFAATEELAPVDCWIFSGGHVGAGRRVNGTIPVRVWTVA